MTGQTSCPNNMNLDQNQLKIVSEKLVDRIDDILVTLEITSLKKDGKRIFGGCPIHGGDSLTAFNLFLHGDYFSGNWKCYTHNCHLTFKKTIIGFIRGILTKKKYGWPNAESQTVGFSETIKWVQDFLNEKLTNIKVSQENVTKQNFINMVREFEREKKRGGLGVSPSQIRSMLNVPSPYFIERGYCPKILSDYLVGDCLKSGKEMNGRAVVPIIEDGLVIGVTGRSIYKECKKCECYHPPFLSCPLKEHRHIYSKWKHNKGFKAEDHLYNFENALEAINKSYAITLVESPGNVWKLLENGVYNVLGTFGCHLTDSQLDCITKTRANMVNLLFDNDKRGAGQKGAALVIEKIKHIYNINNIIPSVNDISEMSNELVKSEIIPQLKEWRF